MSSVNKATLVGRLGKDPEMKVLDNQQTLVKFSMATSEKFKDRSGAVKEETEWHNIVVWGARAEVCHKYLKKGSQVYLEGKIKTRQYDDKDGNTRYTTEITATDVVFLSPMSNNQQQGGSLPASNQNASYQAPTAPSQQADNYDDDLPF